MKMDQEREKSVDSNSHDIIGVFYGNQSKVQHDKNNDKGHHCCGNTLEQLQIKCRTARDIALERIRTQGDISVQVADALSSAAIAWQVLVNSTLQHQSKSKYKEDEPVIIPRTIFAHKIPQAFELLQWLNFIIRLAALDPILGEEMCWDGATHITSHVLIQRTIPFIDDYYTHHDLPEDDEDAINDIRDAASTVAALGVGLRRTGALLREARIQRLPLQFEIVPVRRDSTDSNSSPLSTKSTSILIHQVTARQSAQDDVGFGECILAVEDVH
jgi:hypothetical protein